MIDQGIGVAEPNNADLLMGKSVNDILGLVTVKLVGGTIANDPGDPSNDIAFAPVITRDSTNTVTIVADVGMTKQLDAVWAPGTNAGGLMSAAAIANTTYFTFVIWNETDLIFDFGYDISPTAPTLPSGFTHFKRLSAVLREGGVLVRFFQRGRTFIRDLIFLSYSVANPSAAGVLVTLAVPIGIVVEGIITAALIDDSPAGANFMLVTETAQTNFVPTASANNLELRNSAGVNVVNSIEARRFVDLAGQIRFRIGSTTATVIVRILTIGWVEPES